MRTWQCTTCDTRQYVPSFYEAMRQPSSIRCVSCGDAHHINDQVVTTRIGPALLPVTDAAMRYSPWRMSTTRPAHAGYYEVRFNTLQNPLVLWWSPTDNAFHPNAADARRVVCEQLQCWRGKWANS